MAKAQGIIFPNTNAGHTNLWEKTRGNPQQVPCIKGMIRREREMRPHYLECEYPLTAMTKMNL